jgi:hypothetical protein
MSIKGFVKSNIVVRCFGSPCCLARIQMIDYIVRLFSSFLSRTPSPSLTQSLSVSLPAVCRIVLLQSRIMCSLTSIIFLPNPTVAPPPQAGYQTNNGGRRNCGNRGVRQVQVCLECAVPLTELSLQTVGVGIVCLTPGAPIGTT